VPEQLPQINLHDGSERSPQMISRFTYQDCHAEDKLQASSVSLYHAFITI